MGNGLKKEDSMALKGLAILFMAFNHCYRTIEKFGDYDVIFRFFTQDQVMQFAKYSKICVALFAFVSGYGLMYGYSKILRRESSQTPSKWVGQHLISTLSGYWFIVPISYVMYGFIRNFNFSAWGDTRSEKILEILIDFAGLSEFLGTKCINGSWWYMGAAIAYIILVPFLAVMIERFGGFACMAFLFIFPRCLGIGFQGGNAMYSFLMIMTLGMICCKHDFFTKFSQYQLGENRQTSQIIKGMILAVLVVIGYLTYPKVNLKTIWEYNFVVIPFVVILFCVEYLFKISVVSRVLQLLGRHSLNIWLTHTFVRDWMGEVVFSVREFWLVPLAIVGVSLLISYILNFLKKITGYDRLVQAVLVKLK